MDKNTSQSIIDKINKNGGHAYRVTPYVEPYPDKFADICKNIELLRCISGKKIQYCKLTIIKKRNIYMCVCLF